MPRLNDGIYAPKHFGLGYSSDRAAQVGGLVNFNSSLHVGYTVAVHFPGEPGYETSKETVYDVVSPVSIGSGSWQWQTYPNVRVGIGLGGSSNDFTRVRLQTPKVWKQGDLVTDVILKQASCVVFACESGRSTFAYIVGFGPHQFNTVQDAQDLGHYYRWDFNGISSLVNKDGEYSVTFLGNSLDSNTNAYRDIPSTTGTYFKLDKEGSFIIDNVAGESLKLDKSNKQLSIIGRAIHIQASEKDLTTDSTGKTNIHAQGNAVFNSGKKIYIGSEGSSDPLVLGNKLTDALAALVDDFLNAPLIGQAGPFPCILHPGLRGLLTLWKGIYTKRDTSPFLSKKGYVE